jgi:hypothetical protein
MILIATSDYTTAGNQFIGRATGPSARFGVEIEFVGAKTGKRRDVTRLTVIDPGLYKVRSTTRKGVDDSWVLVWDLDGCLIRTALVEADAMRLAKDLSPGAIAAMGRRVEAADVEEILADSATKDQDELIDVSSVAAAELGLTGGATRRGDVVAARRRFLDRIRGAATLADLPDAMADRRAHLESRRRDLMAQVEQIDLELGK